MRFLSIFMLCILSYGISSAADLTLKKADYQGFPNSLKGRDFFVLPSSAAKTHLKSLEDGDCKENIAKVICLVEPTKNREAPDARKCLEGGADYAIYFERIYDTVPPALQKMFCSLRHLYIETELDGTAYAGTLKDKNGKVDGALMGIRKSVLDEELSLSRWASWKEQLSFGGVQDASYTVTAGLPVVESLTVNSASDFLYFVLAHEFGHIFDFANDLNKTINCKGSETTEKCDFAEGTWGSISWENSDKPKAHNEFINIKKLCFYWCKGVFIAKEEINATYEGLWKSEFISIYASSQAWDDFADSLAYYLMDKNFYTLYRLNTMQDAHYDTMLKLNSLGFAKKYDFIESFLSREDINYP